MEFTGQMLRDRRKALGYSQAALASAIGLSRDFIGQMERGVAEIAPRTAAAVRALKPPGSAPELRTTDPMERLIEAALIDAGIRYETDQGGGTSHRLDFHLPDYDVAIEVKRMHSDRTGAQMARAPNVIVAQGEVAVRFLAAAIRSGDFLQLRVINE
ncbi:helix-turn-helix domain-containing protein [Sphingomonas immobilis]|uniref:Helix-turn-helix transcriptional regulator n=1 Tax=Sphingomonas immobilis TaxID=3063997 RepID=A0ABT8ZVN0_9SPHN|nr:helix-turn-helix transcriptional regulator [Sphingomonas sp. CA1-15]MDO7841055.1 helix-turn-helix transcriptional regulator [Sphingomonas sp. CA1-15]